MKFLLGTALALCAAPFPGRASDALPSETVGYISIDCGDLSIALSLDDVALGRCPVESLQVEAGLHTLRGWPVEGRKYISSFFSRTVQVRAGLETLIDISDMRWVRLETDPYGALVTRDGVPLGRTPVTVSVTRSDPPLLLEREGYRPKTISAGSLISGPQTMKVNLEPAPGGAMAAVPGVSSPVKSRRFGFKTVLLGMSVLGSATAAVAISKEADDTFEEYKTAGDLERMNSLFDRAQRLDTWSVGCWIASEVALGMLLYHLLHEGAREAGEGPSAGASSVVSHGDDQ